MRVRIITLVFFISFIGLSCISQSTRLISDSEGNAIGEFQMFIVQPTNDKEIFHKEAEVNLNFSASKTGEFLLRLNNLVWKNHDHLDQELVIRRDGIGTNDKSAISLKSKSRKYKLRTNGRDLDIKFQGLKNGSHRISLKYEIEDLTKSQVSKSFTIQGLEEEEEQILGRNDLKKLWKNLDKTSVDELTSFYETHFSKVNPGKEDLVKKLLQALTPYKSKLRDYSAKKGDYELYLKVFPTEKDYVKSLDDESKKTNITSKVSPVHNNQNIGKDDESEKEVDPEIISFETKFTGHNKVKISFNNGNDLELSGSAEDIELINQSKGDFEIILQKSKKYLIPFIRPQDSFLVNAEVDNSFQIEANKESNGIRFEIKGGMSPFRVEFIKKDHEISSLASRFEDIIPNEKSEIYISKKEMAQSGMEGIYETAILFDNTTELSQSVSIDFSVEKTGSKTLTILILGLTLLLMVAAYLMWKKKKAKEKRKQYLSMAQNLSPVTPSQATQQVPLEKKKITITKEVKKSTPASSKYVSTGKMKITKKSSKGGLLDKSTFIQGISSKKYCELKLKQHWKDTTIEKIFLSKPCISNLGKFLREENLHGITDEIAGAIPEVGGFLMGNHYQEENGTIMVSIEKFVPFVPEYHDVFKIEIGTQTLVEELGDAQDNNPNMDVIGWFHTHPGHGLFLSNSDLAVQKHFPQPYQVAMEIDSLTERLDTAFFTRTSEGPMNNVRDLNEIQWFSWKEIENSIV